MINRLVHKRSEVAGRVPATADLLLGELAINVADGKIFLKKKPANGAESVVQLGEVSLSGDVSGSGAGNIVVTLADTGVSAGTYASVTVDAKGRVTGGTNAPAITGGSINGATIGATTASTGRFTSLTTTGNTTVGGALTVTGNLTVNGTVTKVNSTSVTLDDPIITLGGDVAPTVDDGKDRGVEFRWHNGSVARIGFFGFDDSTGKFTFIPDATNTSEVFTGTKGTLDAFIDFADVLNKPTTLAGYGVGVIPDAHLSGTYTGVNVSGNAGTATKLATARTINGVAFDGTANITVADATKLPLTGGTLTGALNITTATKSLAIATAGIERGFIEADTYGIRIRSRAADTTVAGTITLGADGSTSVTGALSVGGTITGNGSGLTALDAASLASGILPDARLSGTYTGVSITGNAATATKLATARTINGVAFDGTTNITVADGTKLPLTGGTLTGTLTGTRAQFTGTGNDYHLGGLEVRGNGTGNTVFPTIGFHQPGLWASSLQLRGASDFRFYAQGGAAYADVTAASFTGSASGLTGIPASQITGTVPDAVLPSTITSSITGNAATATKLATARTINGVAFDGTANITVTDSASVSRTGDTITGKISVGDTAKRSAGMYGLYDSAKIAHIWSMGPAYAIPDDGTTFGALYGMAYKHTNNATGGAMAGGHQIVFANNGTPGVSIGLAGGVWTSGTITAGTFNATTTAGGGFQGIDADTAAAPSFTWSADLDTGIYRPVADTVGFTTAGAERVRIDSSGLTSQTWLRTIGQSGWYSQTYGGGLYMTDSTWVRVYGGKAFYVANDIAATGNVTAYYSDERLKENIRPIENALDTLCTLQGVRYNANELAGTFGYDRSKQEVGLLAQQVQAVMPEAVEQAPFDRTGVAGESKTGEHYLTLKYERMVPLLVEAIKEQKSLIDELRAGMDELRAEIRALKG